MEEIVYWDALCVTTPNAKIGKCFEFCKVLFCFNLFHFARSVRKW